MALDHLAFDQIAHADLLQLIENGVAEDRMIEYKRGAVGSDDAAKREFLKDVSAFGNASGGFMVFGMEEDKSVPTRLVGVAVPDIGAELQRLEGIIRDNLEPHLVGVQIRQIPRPDGHAVILIRVQRSWNPPHRVTFKGWNKFFVRNSNGVHEMSVQELRTQFLSAATLTERIEKFRTERLGVIAQGGITEQIAAPMRGPGKDRLILHLIPFGSFADAALVDLEQAHALHIHFIPIGSDFHHSFGFTPTFNFDGMFLYAQINPDQSFGSYTQVFRNGVVETACAGVVYKDRDMNLLNGVEVEKCVIAALESMCAGLAKLQLGPPVAVLISLANVRGSHLHQEMPLRPKPALSRDHLPIPAVTLDTLSLQGDWHRNMKRPFDAIWNAYGYAQSPSFKSGAWSAK